MNPFERYIVWLRRMSHSRGFGVQSPSAYRFIRYVLCEHYPYYAYAELRRKYPYAGWLARKRMELYFRIANFRQASRLVSNGDDVEMLSAYVEKGCRRTRVVAGVGDDETVEVARVCPAEGCEEYLDRLLANADSSTVVIVEDIAASPVAGRMWRRLLDSTSVSVSYDLHWAGVAFFDTERFKTNYIVNF